VEQPGYDALAQLYADSFPAPYQCAVERRAVEAFVDEVREHDPSATVFDVGSGIGHVTADLVRLGIQTIGLEPSNGMRTIAMRTHPECHFIDDDALLARAATDIECGAILARFSLIHVPPEELPDVLAAWATRLAGGAPVLIGAQASLSADTIAFDHRVAPAWRWHPDALARVLFDAGFDESWRMIAQADDTHRFAELHLMARRR